MKSHIKLTQLCYTAVTAALVCISTLIIQIPSPFGGYINLGDCFVLVGAWLLPPACGFAAGSIGSALADIISGYVIYAPASAVIKGCMALVTTLIFRKISDNKRFCHTASAACGEAVMVTGYFLYEALVLYGFSGATINLAANLVQGTAGAVCACVLMVLLQKTRLHSRLQ